MKTIKIDKLKINPDNPRFIKDEKYEKLKVSILESRTFMDLNPIKVDENNLVLGGNMRLRACKELGWKEVPFAVFTRAMAEENNKGREEPASYEEQCRELIIKDNMGYGEDDWEVLAADWDMATLEYWGKDLPGMDFTEGEEGFSLPDGEKSPFRQITFTMADEQATQVDNAIKQIKDTEEFNYVETFGNENSNGNALYLLVMQWVEQKK